MLRRRSFWIKKIKKIIKSGIKYSEETPIYNTSKGADENKSSRTYR